MFKKNLLPLFSAFLVLLLILSGFLTRFDKWLQDALFQQPRTPSGDIIIIGIDNTTLSELGPYGLNYRSYVAYGLEKLASDPDNLPAVVAVDVLYEGESGTAADMQLTEAAAKLSNVVTACMAEFGSEVTWEDNRAVSLNAAAVVNFVEPYDSLKAVTTQGHINAMLDMQIGILRHAMLTVPRPDGEKVYSMAVQAARLVLEQKGQELTLPHANHYYIPFSGKPKAFDDGYNLYNLLMGNIPSSAWANKIVLIGPYAPALQDTYYTSVNWADPMYGVEFQANVIQSLLEKNLKSVASDTFQLVLCGILFVIVSFLFFKLNMRIGAFICLFLVIISFGGALLFWGAGVLVHVLWLPLGILLLYLVSLISHYITASRERRALALEKERVSTELALATRIQASFLPKVFPPFPDRHEFDLYASMTPAREVGGDLYDFFLIDEDHLCMVIGDVSGKGVPASLFMMLASALIHHVAMHEVSPAKILTEVNAEICTRNPEEMFVTVWLGVLDISTGILTAANAGHEYPAVRQSDGSFELLKDKHGFVLGGMEGIRYREYTLPQQPGSRFFVYTDGVPEATDANQQMYGPDRMLEALRTAETRDPQTILEAVKSSVSAFVGDAEQFDDLTMLC